jgi:hypothetical protein
MLFIERNLLLGSVSIQTEEMYSHTSLTTGFTLKLLYRLKSRLPVVWGLCGLSGRGHVRHANHVATRS